MITMKSTRFDEKGPPGSGRAFISCASEVARAAFDHRVAQKVSTCV
jgi:hypothetical protein